MKMASLFDKILPSVSLELQEMHESGGHRDTRDGDFDGDSKGEFAAIARNCTQSDVVDGSDISNQILEYDLGSDEVGYKKRLPREKINLDCVLHFCRSSRGQLPHAWRHLGISFQRIKEMNVVITPDYESGVNTVAEMIRLPRAFRC